MIQSIFAPHREVEVRAFDGLLVDFARSQGTRVVIRGLRAISDFEYEFQMALMNRSLAPDIETFFMMPSVDYSFLSSNLVREVAALGGSIESLVPAPVARKLRNKVNGANKVQTP